MIAEQVKGRRFLTRASILRFLRRLLVAFVGVSAFFVITQDLQVFPCIVSGLFGYTGGGPPAGVTSTFVATEDGTSIDVWKVGAEGKTQRVVVIFHGNADTLPNVSRLQQRLAHSGITSYSFDYRGAGRSSGWPTEEGIYQDGRAVVQYAARDSNVAVGDLGILGVSIGTGPAAYVAQLSHPKVLVLAAPYVSFNELVSEMPLFGLLTPFLKYEFPTLRYLKGMHDGNRGPVLTVVHGQRDTVVPYRHSERLLRELGEGRMRLITYPAAGHNDVVQVGVQEVVKGLLLDYPEP